MADSRPRPTGETTLPPPPAPGSAPARADAKVFLRSNPGVEVLPPVRPPARQPVPARRKPRRPARWWAGQVIPFLGLAVFLGCLYALLEGFSQPQGPSAGPRASGPVSAPPLAGAPMVVLDPGHGGLDTGAVALGLQEKSLNLDVALRARRFLEARGVPVRMTRYTDEAVSLEERVRVANAAPGAIFVSIHFNDALAGEGGQSYRASGVETYYSGHKETGTAAGDWLWTSLFGGGGHGPDAAAQRDALAASVRQGESLADAIQDALVLATSAADRGTKERGLYVTRRVHGPAVLVEGGFISHPAEAKHLGEAAYREKLAEAIAAGIVKYLQASGRPPGSGNAGGTPPAA